MNETADLYLCAWEVFMGKIMLKNHRVSKGK